MFRKAFLLDLLERSIWTFIQAAGALLIADGTDVVAIGSFGDKLKLAAIAGGIAVMKCVLASQVGNSGTAQALPGVESAYVNEPNA